MINYSFIIPHKNVPGLLERCVLSIPYRPDVEIIVVDDCSENSDILQNIDCLKRENVQIIYLSQSKGAGFARNEGVKISRGKWLLFADADDYYTSDLEQVLGEYATDNITDIVYLNAQAIDENSIVSPLAISRYIENYNNRRIYSEKVLRYANWAPWTRMVKRDLVEDYCLKFEEIPVGNDAMFCLECSKYAKNIKTESNVLYNYYKPSGGSYTFHYYNISNLESMIDLRFRINRLYHEVGFLFKQTLFVPYLTKKDYRNNKEYKFCCKKTLRKNKYSIIEDMVNVFVFYMGKFFRII